MTVNRTTLLDLPLPVTGTESGTWGDTTNNGLTQYLDIAIAGTLVLSTDADVTLTSTEGDSSATNIGATTAQYAILRWTATGSTTRNITALAQSKTYVVINATGGTQSIVLRGAGPTTGVTIISGEKAFCVWNGSDFVKVSSSAAAGGSNTQVQYNSSGVLAGSSNMTFDGTSLSLKASPNLIFESGGNERGRIVTGTGAFELMAGSTVTPTISLASSVATFTNNPVLSGGTANGVLYLNGSKVATSGSALTFNGTSLGVGTSDYGNAGSINVAVGVPATTTGGLQLWSTASASHYMQFGDSTAGDGPYRGAVGYNHTLDALQFFASGSEKMVLTSTGLGIGTSSPTTKLYVTVSAASTACAAFFNTDTANGNGLYVKAGGANSGKYALAVENAAGTSLAYLDSSGNLGIGTSSPAAKLHVQGTYGYFADGTYSGYFGKGNGVVVGGGAADLGISTSTGSIVFGTGGSLTERMRLDTSGNLGLGVTPSAWNGAKGFESGLVGNYFIGSTAASYTSIGTAAYYNGTNWTYARSTGASKYELLNNTHAWFTAPSGTAGNLISFTQAMTLDSSGNLGLGVTPSAWTVGKAIEINSGGNAVWGLGTNSVQLVSNYYYDGSYRYKANGYANRYDVGSSTGIHAWFTAPSGTAGNAITFTQAMTLDASGNLVVGNTSASYRLDVWGSTSIVGQIRNNTVGTGVLAQLQFSTSNNYDGFSKAAVGAICENANTRATALGFYSEGSDGTLGERARITSGGLMGLGMTPTGSYSLQIYGIGASTGSARIRLQNSSTGSADADGGGIAMEGVDLVIQNSENGVCKWEINGSERARITSGGDLLVGTTSYVDYANGFGVSPAPGFGTVVSIGHESAASSGRGYIIFGYNGSGIGSITQNGTTAVAYNTSSDYRLKNTIAPMTGALAKVAQLKPVTYKWNADGSAGEGFIAHELAEVVPQCVTGEKDAVDAEGKPVYQGIDTSFLVATLTAAIQEQQALITSLTARVALLEGN